MPNNTKQYIAGVLVGESFTAPSHIAWGDSSTVLDAASTSLTNELERNALDSSERSVTSVEYVGYLTESEMNGSTVREVGLFNASANGTAFSLNNTPNISKNSTFRIQTMFRVRVK